jgi:iron complex transport system ATP-binding protein
LEVRDVDFYYGDNKAIDGISLTLEPAKFYGILGPNGCGKTTFLDLVMQNRKPCSGTIEYKGRNIKSYSRLKLAREISLVPQDFYINFPFTVRDIVLMGRHPHIPRFAFPSSKDLDIVNEAMGKMGIDVFGNKYITELSGGEKQRVIFARAMAQDTPVLILDEVTSNMDIQHTLNSLDIMAYQVESKGRTVIAALHDLNLAAAYCDELIFMKSGKIVSQGPTCEVLSETNIKNVFGVDSKIYFDGYSDSKQVVFKRIKGK